MLLADGREGAAALGDAVRRLRHERDRGVLPLEPVRADPEPDSRGRGRRADGAEDVDLPERVRVVALADQRVAGVRPDLRGVLAGHPVGDVSEEDLHQGVGGAARAAGAR